MLWFTLPHMVGRSLELHEYKLERRQVIHNQRETWLHEHTSVNLLQGTTHSISCCCQHSLTQHNTCMNTIMRCPQECSQYLTLNTCFSQWQCYRNAHLKKYTHRRDLHFIYYRMISIKLSWSNGRDGSRNIGSLIIQPPVAAASPKSYNELSCKSLTLCTG